MFDIDLFRSQLKKYRSLNGYSHERLSEIVGIDNRTYGNIERGEQVPTLNTLVKLLDTFNTNYVGFMSNTDIDRRAMLIKEINENFSRLSSQNKERVLDLSKSIDTVNAIGGLDDDE